VLLIPWARHHYLLPVLLAGAILANHAAISAVVLNVQPRYIAVTNPYKGFLLLALVYIIGLLLVRIADEWLERG
jgi:VIT1/CCC1 family predicted Fe2+/Mn2+ transporter